MGKIVAFIPVRGGSKSIPLKNIKPLCGKPLVCWVIEELEKTSLVDEIVVATDSEKIRDVVLSYPYKKVNVYDREPQNASDTASTESVMLEYINKSNLQGDDVFMLVQATSPLTQEQHFSEALDLFFTKKYDSIITCVKTMRFYWTPQGESLNYDYMNRPRRQDFQGTFVENGAFYISTVKSILKTQNRISGSIGIYEMPEYTEVEIDEPSDFVKIEEILNSRQKEKEEIKLFVSDIDGTLTDGGMYYGENGEEMKKFNTKDGLGMRLLKERGIKVGLITSENKKLNDRRAQKLGVDFIVQGCYGISKLDALKRMAQEYGLKLSQVAYIGDDLNCREILSAVGLSACPNDASSTIKTLSNIHVMQKKGGEGCVREFIDEFIIK